MAKWLILIVVVLLLCIAECFREIFTFKITHYDIISEKLIGLERERKVLFLSDLHSNSYGHGNERLLQAIRAQNPDLIFVGGDMLVGNKGASSQVAERLMEQLVKLCPVYYANGNHEQRMKLFPETYGTQYQEYKKILEDKGVKCLENEHADIVLDDCPMQIHGLEIPYENYKKFRKTPLTVEQVTACIGQADPDKFQILLAHNPIYMNTYLEWGADMILSGHLHGGIVRIPGLGGVITPQFELFPKFSGEYTKQGTSSVVVSKGLGTHTIKMRLFNPAELIVLRIQGIEK